MTAEEPLDVVRRLLAATNAHDIDAVVGCFAADYRNVTPAHPARGFVGADQVRANWTTIFAHIPDLHTELLASAVDGPHVWTEWEHRGTRPDGTPHLMRGVVVFEVHSAAITSARFYLEPVDEGLGTVGEAVRDQVRPAGSS